MATAPASPLTIPNRVVKRPAGVSPLSRLSTPPTISSQPTAAGKTRARMVSQPTTTEPSRLNTATPQWDKVAHIDLASERQHPHHQSNSCSDAQTPQPCLTRTASLRLQR